MITAEQYDKLLGGPSVKPYQPIEHPHFAGRESVQPCEERWKLIQSVDLPDAGMCVDIGCHTGWFCRKFSHNGWRAVGFDTKATEIDVARNLMRPFEGPVEPMYWHGDVAHLELPVADIVLCLSVVMYWFNPQFGKTEEEAWAILQKISEASPRMFLDFGGQHNTLTPDFPDGVLMNTTYTNYRLLGRTAFESRPFYYFSRSPAC